MGGLSYGAKIQVPGAFTLQGIPPEDYTVSIRDTPPGCYVQEATYGGATVLGTMLRLSGGAAGEMRITLACDAGSLRARVVDGAGTAVPFGTLFVIPEDLTNPALLPPAMRQLEIRDGWTEPADSLPPGRYLLLPCNVETDGTAAPILRFWNARSRAKEVSIEPGASAQVTLELIEVP